MDDANELVPNQVVAELALHDAGAEALVNQLATSVLAALQVLACARAEKLISKASKAALHRQWQLCLREGLLLRSSLPSAFGCVPRGVKVHSWEGLP